jgi:hypothetical protein
MEHKIKCNDFTECRKYDCKKYQEPNNKLWYCLVKSHECEKIMYSYHNMCECITKLVNNLLVRYKKGKKLRSINKSKRKAKFGYEYIPPYRPAGGYLRYVILLNPKDRIQFKKCLEECLKTRKQHHSLCEKPEPLELHENEKFYLMEALKYVDRNMSLMKNVIKATLDKEVDDIINIILDPDTNPKKLDSYKILLKIREQNKVDFENNHLSGWITDDETEFKIIV